MGGERSGEGLTGSCMVSYLCLKVCRQRVAYRVMAHVHLPTVLSAEVHIDARVNPPTQRTA